MKKYLIVIVFAFIAPSAAFAYGSFNTSLSYGTSGNAVTQLQQFLISQHCLSVEPTGYFGSLTLVGVKCFQIKYGISGTGFFGVLSRGTANTILAVSNQSSTTQPVQGAQSSVNLSQGVEASPTLSPLTGTGSSSINLTPITVTPTADLSPLVGSAVVPPASTSMSQGANAAAPLSPLVGSGSFTQ